MATTKNNNEKWYAVYVMSASDYERMENTYANEGGESEECPNVVELTLVKSTDREQAKWQGAWKLEDRYRRGGSRCGKLIPICTRIATQKDFQLWKNKQKFFNYKEFEEIVK